MALYRFLFAPALLAVAVLHGSPERAPAAPPAPPAVRAVHAEASRQPMPTPAVARAPDEKRPVAVPAVGR